VAVDLIALAVASRIATVLVILEIGIPVCPILRCVCWGMALVFIAHRLCVIKTGKNDKATLP